MQLQLCGLCVYRHQVCRYTLSLSPCKSLEFYLFTLYKYAFKDFWFTNIEICRMICICNIHLWLWRLYRKGVCIMYTSIRILYTLHHHFSTPFIPLHHHLLLPCAADRRILLDTISNESTLYHTLYWIHSLSTYTLYLIAVPMFIWTLTCLPERRHSDRHVNETDVKRHVERQRAIS